jgi:hypothetical protein
MNFWAKVRLVLIAGSLVGAFFMPPEPTAVPPIHWDFLPLALVSFPFMLLFVIWVQYINPYSASVWRHPDWNVNPFNFSEPLQFFHMGAFIFIAQGVGFLIKLAITQTSIFPEALMGITLGISTLFGIKLCTLVFRKKMQRGI